MPKSVDDKPTLIRSTRETSSTKPTTHKSSHSIPSYLPYIQEGPSVASTSASGSNGSFHIPDSNSVSSSTEASTSSVQQVKPKLAPSLSGRQLLNQRLQKYKLPAIFRANQVGPPQEPRWKGSFWIKGTLLGASNLEHSKAAAKEGAAMSALKWLNNNHYY